MDLDYPQFRHPALDRFAPVAERFCKLIESRAHYGADALLQDVHTLLAQLYSLALELPHTDVLFAEDEPDEEDKDAHYQIPEHEPDPDRGDREEWRAVFSGLGEQLGDRCHYREIFDPYSSANETEVTGSLADDLSDTFFELRSGLRKWQRGDTGEALWEWRFGFESHWGEHATSALRAIRSLSASYDLPWPLPQEDRSASRPEARD